jgi:DNA repair exonuclease SbcCD ATPase subunit
MATAMTLAEFYNYVRTSRKRMADVYRETEEIQFQFNDLHTRQLTERNKLVSALAPQMLTGSDLSETLKGALEARVQVERQLLLDRIAALNKELAEARENSERLITEGQKQIAYLREQNPVLNQQEEGLKTRRASLQQKLEELDAQIKRTGCLTGYAARRRLQAEHKKLTANIAAMTQGIRTVREKWKTEREKVQAGQVEMQSTWQSLSVEISQKQALVDDLTANLESRSRADAARNLLTELKEPPADAGSWKDRLAPLAELNKSVAQYVIGLTSVAEILGLLKGLGEGMDRFIRSVGTVYEEQSRYKLAELRLTIPDEATAFHAYWPTLQAMVKDEKYLGTHPLEFSQKVKEAIGSRLGTTQIQKMFEQMGAALTAATKQWR